MAVLANLSYHISKKGTPCPLLILLSAVVICLLSVLYMMELMSKYALMTFIHHMASAGSPEKSVGSAAFNSVGVDIVFVGAVGPGVAGVTVGAGGVTRLKVQCLWGLGLLEIAAGVVMVVEGHSGGKDGVSSSLESSKSLKAWGFLGFDMLVGKSCSYINRRN